MDIMFQEDMPALLSLGMADYHPYVYFKINTDLMDHRAVV